MQFLMPATKSDRDKCKQFSIYMLPNKPENVNESLAKYFYETI